MKMGLAMGYMKAQPIGLQHIRLKHTNEHFTIHRPNSQIKNLIIGTMYIEHVGPMTVTNWQTGEVCIIDFKSEGWGGKNRHAIEGYIYESRQEADAKKK